MPARLACATVPAYVRDSKWSPAPTVGHPAQRSGHRHLAVRSADCAGGVSRDRSASGPALCRAFLLMAWFPLSDGAGRSQRTTTREAPSPLRPASTSAFEYPKSD